MAAIAYAVWDTATAKTTSNIVQAQALMLVVSRMEPVIRIGCAASGAMMTVGYNGIAMAGAATGNAIGAVARGSTATANGVANGAVAVWTTTGEAVATWIALVSRVASYAGAAFRIAGSCVVTALTATPGFVMRKMVHVAVAAPAVVLEHTVARAKTGNRRRRQ